MLCNYDVKRFGNEGSTELYGIIAVFRMGIVNLLQCRCHDDLRHVTLSKVSAKSVEEFDTSSNPYNSTKISNVSFAIYESVKLTSCMRLLVISYNVVKSNLTRWMS